MSCIIYIFLYIHIQLIWPQMVVEDTQRSTWTRPFRDLRDAPLGGRCGETMELDGREPTINAALQLSRHPNVTHEKEQFWLEARRNYARRYDTTPRWRSAQLCGSSKAWTERVRPKVGHDRVCIFIVYSDGMERRWCLSTPGSAKYMLPVTLSTSVTPASPYSRHSSLKMYLEAGIERVRRFTWRLWSCELGVRNRAILEMHLNAVIQRIWRYTWRPRSSGLRDALGGQD